MNAKQVREMTNLELNQKLNDLKEELFKLRFAQATNNLANGLSMSVCKKDIARIKTILRERELNGNADLGNQGKAKA